MGTMQALTSIGARGGRTAASVGRVGQMWLTLLPLAVGSAVTPSYYLLEILLLESDRGRAKAAMFAAGFGVMKVVLGLAFGATVVTDVSGAGAERGTSPVVATLLLASGLLFLGMGVREVLGSSDASDAPPRWMSMVDRLTPLRTFALACGMLLAAPNLWVFTLTAVATIKDAGLSTPVAVVWFLVFVLLTLAPMLAVVGVVVAMPTRSDALLGALRAWLMRHNRAIMIGVFGVLGVALTWAGLDRLAL